MSDAIITAYGSGGYQTFLDAEAVTTTAGQLNTLRQRVQISVRDITTGTPTEVGDAATQAIRVCVVGGALSATVNNVSITALGPNFPVVTVTGNLTTTPTPNVTVTNWTASATVSISGAVTQGTSPWIVGGTVTATGVSIQQATVTQGTLPWTVTYSQGTQVVTYSAGTQVVTVTAVPGQLLDEMGSIVPWGELQTMFMAMVFELRAIRFGMQYLVAQMNEAAGAQFDLREAAEEWHDESELTR